MMYQDPVVGHSLQVRLGRSLNSLYRLDEMYYALLDLVDREISVSPLALNAIILGAGRRGNLDRAFATFQECSSLFKVLHVAVKRYVHTDKRCFWLL